MDGIISLDWGARFWAAFNLLVWLGVAVRISYLRAQTERCPCHEGRQEYDDQPFSAAHCQRADYSLALAYAEPFLFGRRPAQIDRNQRVNIVPAAFLEKLKR